MMNCAVARTRADLSTVNRRVRFGKASGIERLPTISVPVPVSAVKQTFLLLNCHGRVLTRLARHFGVFVSKLSQFRRQSVTSITHLPAT
jgi:hypothetical protein